ncbi:MAG: ATP-binding protein [Heliobacteriaceae bacterium]|jgi:predicted AAA+ superfamily ATPase|nr:ATP-binding protein [Heliobacteriaceae bacterium]
MIIRQEYTEKLKAFKDKQLIKVVSGIRRCGKSTLLRMFQEDLIESGVGKDQIISINFEDPDYVYLTSYKALYDYIKERLLPDKKNYIFLDEIQNVTDYQKAVDGLFIKENVDVYITGSNAYFLSGELSTLLSGRYVEIKMLPLSFKEYLSALPDKIDLPAKYTQYLTHSSFPYTLELGNDEIRTYLDGIYNTVILKDVVQRKNIADVSGLENIIKFMFDNIGNITSPKKISDTLGSSGRKISNHTVENYLSALIDSFILYKTSRYDVKGKQYLRTSEKYYLVDIGLRYFLLGSKKADIGRILENIVYLELLRRGYEVYIGKVGNLEVDFVAIKRGISGDVEYYQVAQTVQLPETWEREMKPLESIKDHNPKFLLTLDNEPVSSHKGIKQIYALDWLLEYH